ncbi:MAG: aldose 1-epimerase family protein [Alphaproteobacteria bacterium]|nr:MAG: aldose 1-epimerase family protein [Alphaproteobacteria bacterium]
MPETASVTIASEQLRATFSSLGAELVRLQGAAGVELLWSGDPAVWAGRSPLLFPIVGGVKDDRISVGGKAYPLSRHGFARTSTFELIDAQPSRCLWRLRANEETRARYPFAFRLDVAYAVDGNRLTLAATVANEGDGPMPASFGFHPAFRWPLSPSLPREQHEIRFDKRERAPIRRLNNGLLGEAVPSPVQGDRMVLADSLFAEDALIWDRLQSRSLSYGGPTGPSLRLDFPDMPHLGIWSKPGAGFVCLEPWQGFASPVGFDGELAEKPGIIVVSAGSTRDFTLTVTVL